MHVYFMYLACILFLQESLEKPYIPLEPTQPPIDPPYQKACLMKRMGSSCQEKEEPDSPSEFEVNSPCRQRQKTVCADFPSPPTCKAKLLTSDDSGSAPLLSAELGLVPCKESLACLRGNPEVSSPHDKVSTADIDTFPSLLELREALSGSLSTGESDVTPPSVEFTVIPSLRPMAITMDDWPTTDSDPPFPPLSACGESVATSIISQKLSTSGSDATLPSAKLPVLPSCGVGATHSDNIPTTDSDAPPSLSASVTTSGSDLLSSQHEPSLPSPEITFAGVGEEVTHTCADEVEELNQDIQVLELKDK